MASMGALSVEVQVNAARTQEDMGRVVNIIDGGARRINTAAAGASASISNIARAGRTVGRVKGAEEAAKSIDKVAHSSVAARREMLVLAHELSQGNFKRFGGSLMVLGEQMDWMGKIMSPTGLAIGAVAATTAIAAEMFIKGAEESAHFAKAITLTGNYAGVTEGQFNAMSARVAEAAHASTGATREILTGLIETGRFGPQSLEAVGTAAAILAKVSGEKSEEVVKEFAKMSDGALKWAMEANKQYHFVDGALVEHVSALEAAGKKEEAFAVVAEAVTAAMAGRQKENVKGFAKVWDDVTTAIKNALEAMHQFGNAPTPEEHIKSLRDALAVAQAHPETTMGEFGPHDASKRAVTLQKELGEAVSQARRQQDNVELTRARQAASDQVAVYKEQWKGMLKTAHIGKSELNEELEKIATIGHGSGASDAEIKALQDKKRKEFAGKDGAGGVQRAETQGILQPLERQIQGEEKLLAYREKVLAQYHKADLISDQGYYDTRRTVIEAAEKRIETLYDQEIAAAQNQAARVTDARAKIEANNKVEDLRMQKQAALQQIDEAQSQNNFELAQSTEKYRDEVTKLNAELDKLRHTQSNSAGADFDRTHAGIRKQATLQNDTGTLQTLAQSRAATQAQADMNDLKERGTLIENALKQAEAQTQLQVQTGQKTEVQGWIDIGDKQKASADQLQVIADKMTAIANASGFDDLKDQAAQFQLQVSQIKASSDQLGKTVSDTFSGAFANSLLSVQNGTKSLKQAFQDMANAIIQNMLRIADNNIAQMLFSNGGGASGASGGSGGSGGGSGGLFGQLVGLAISAFGASSGDPSGVGLGTGNGSTPADLMSGYSGRASGGSVQPSTMYEVNERGPELLTYANKTFLMMGDKGGTVTPASGAGGRQSVFNMNIAVPAGTTRQSAQQQAAEIMRHAQIAQARNG